MENIVNEMNERLTRFRDEYDSLLRELREGCPMRDAGGTCRPCSGVCEGVGNALCEVVHNAYSEGIRDAINAVILDPDVMAECLWKRFEDVPMNPETEEIETEFLGFPAGTHREEIWHWFDGKHSKGVAYLLYGESAGVRKEESDARTVRR